MGGNGATLVSVKNVLLRFGGTIALTGVDIEIKEGEILAIIGPNGAGKTCFLNCLSGIYRPQEGEILFKRRNLIGMRPDKISHLGIGRTFQKNELFSGLSTVDNLLAARHMHFKSNALFAAIYFGPGRKEEIRHRIVAEEIMRFLGIEAIRDLVVGALPMGLRKTVELGRALALEPKLLLLDEPVAGMNIDETEDTVRVVLDIFELRGIPIVLVEHDMGVVMDIADRVIVFDFGRIIAEGTPEQIRSNPDVIKAYLGEDM
jgi:branched-chain amino acid transport system ATP-binding protein